MNLVNLLLFAFQSGITVYQLFCNKPLITLDIRSLSGSQDHLLCLKPWEITIYSRILIEKLSVDVCRQVQPKSINHQYQDWRQFIRTDGSSPDSFTRYHSRIIYCTGALWDLYGTTGVNKLGRTYLNWHQWNSRDLSECWCSLISSHDGAGMILMAALLVLTAFMDCVWRW